MCCYFYHGFDALFFIGEKRGRQREKEEKEERKKRKEREEIETHLDTCVPTYYCKRHKYLYLYSSPLVHTSIRIHIIYTYNN